MFWLPPPTVSLQYCRRAYRNNPSFTTECSHLHRWPFPLWFHQHSMGFARDFALSVGPLLFVSCTLVVLFCLLFGCVWNVNSPLIFLLESMSLLDWDGGASPESVYAHDLKKVTVVIELTLLLGMIPLNCNRCTVCLDLNWRDVLREPSRFPPAPFHLFNCTL